MTTPAADDYTAIKARMEDDDYIPFEGPLRGPTSRKPLTPEMRAKMALVVEEMRARQARKISVT